MRHSLATTTPFVFATIFLCSVGNGEDLKAGSNVAKTIWDVAALSSPPKMQWLNSNAPIRSLTYAGEQFQGHATDVFAFYATPGTLSGDTSVDKDLPAVVLIHGGGGTAFAEWVWLWAERGYAAIAMDLSGRRPEAPKFENGKLIRSGRVKRTRLENGGPEHGHAEKFGSVGGSVDDDWPYHAVSSVIRAHSLIRSFAEVDEERTAVTGISWGGYTTCIVASVDHRFKAAVPVYGCGFLYDGESVQRSRIDALPGQQREEWIHRYDPSSHLLRCRVPILFVNGTNDKHYPLRSYSRSFELVPGPKQIRIEVRMPHGHPPGWAPKEIGLFIDSKLNGSPGLPVLGTPTVVGGAASASCTASGEPVSGQLHFTTDTGPLVDRKWQTVDAVVKAGSVSSDSLPADASIWFLSVADSRGASTSTDVVFAERL